MPGSRDTAENKTKALANLKQISNLHNLLKGEEALVQKHSGVEGMGSQEDRSRWDLVPRPGIKPRPRALGAQSPSHWTTREVPRLFCMYICMTAESKISNTV